MLKEIYIENLAVIEKAVIPFSGEFNVFTGETGAGKSILINGINAVLGQRVTRDIVRTGTKKAVVTALFTGLDKSVIQKLEEYGISHENDEITVTREIFADGGSTARINSRVTTVSVLKDISTLLITIHGQHDNQILLSPENHLNVIDQFGETVELLEDYKQSFRNLQNLAKQIGNMKKAGAERRNRIIFLKERIAELESLELREGENEQLENEYQLIQNTDKIARVIQLVKEILNGENETNIIDMMSECENEISGISDYSGELADIAERISAAVIE
ncbi:MAG: AAA family ATPase, partial [Oscillospiraceae bacterium]|nr:AAA family ATPase [Oscillospiraceae bacterium]